MKTINSIRLILSIIALAAFMLVLKSCKKTDVDAPNNNSAAIARAAAIQAIKAQYGNVSAGIVYNVNKTADEIFYKNAAGKMVSLYSNNNPLIARPCIYNCNNTTNPADLYITYTLDYVQRFYICESSTIPPPKSTLSVRWTVSVPFAITNETPDGVLNTFGKVKFTPSVGAAVILTATANDPNFTVTNLGTDPGCGVNTLYAVTYYFTEVDNSNFTSGTQLDALLSLSNDCALIGYLSATGYVSGPTFNQNAYLPCNRIDKVYIYSTLQLPGPYVQAIGNYAAICTHPAGFIRIDYHQLEYRKVTAANGSTNWDDQPMTGLNASWVYWGRVYGTTTFSPTITGFGAFDLIRMTPGTGTWLVRYRNIKNSVCDVIYNTLGNNSGSTTPLAGGFWGNPALWVTQVVQE